MVESNSSRQFYTQYTPRPTRIQTPRNNIAYSIANKRRRDNQQRERKNKMS